MKPVLGSNHTLAAEGQMAKENRGDSDRRQDDRRKEGAVVPPDGVERRQGNRRQDERRKTDE